MCAGNIFTARSKGIYGRLGRMDRVRPGVRLLGLGHSCPIEVRAYVTIEAGMAGGPGSRPGVGRQPGYKNIPSMLLCFCRSRSRVIHSD